jgi:hypothetical protein
MAKCGTNRKALHKEVSSIFAGVWITKESGIQQQPSAPGSIGDGHAAPKPSTVVRQTRLQPGCGHHDRARQETVGRTQPGFAAIIKRFKRVIRHILPSRSRRQEKRLRSDWDNWRC